ncbi:hypothetical protein COCC4DRAFT_29766, partial [Bipolaris maydis ATCC 48331]
MPVLAKIFTSSALGSLYDTFYNTAWRLSGSGVYIIDGARQSAPALDLLHATCPSYERSI